METTTKRKNKNSTIWAGLIAFIAFFAGKLKFLIVFAKLIKFNTLISMFISVGVYALVYGWKFAVGFIYLLFMHEMGHLLAMKRQGLPVKPAIFIPFFGAVIGVDPKLIRNAKVESYIAFGGPLLGTIAFLPFAALYWGTHEPLWGVLMFVGAFLNFFNLAPISPLDGGRIVGVLSPKLWFLGLLGMVVYTFFRPSPVMFFILVFGTMALFQRRKQLLKHDLLIEKIAFLTEELSADFTSFEENEVIFNQIHKEEIRLKELGTVQEPKIKKHKELMAFKREMILDKMDRLSRYNADELMDQYINEKTKLLNDYKLELDRLQGYYDADTKTKWNVLLIYLALVIFLAFFVGYGQEIMNAHSDEVIR